MLSLRTIAGAACLSLASAAAAGAPVTQYVNPFIGTSGGGAAIWPEFNGLGGWGNAQLPLCASVPFGVLRLGPDTTLVLTSPANGSTPAWSQEVWLRWDHYAGVHYTDSHIVAFSHTHLQGGGMDDLGNIGVMPVRQWGASDVINASSRRSYKAAFEHDGAEVAAPGYYAVRLRDVNVSVEVVASGTHAGVHEYSCDAGPLPCILLVDVCHTTYDYPCAYGEVNMTQGVDANGQVQVEMSGLALDAGDFAQHDALIGGVNVYFYAVATARVRNASVTSSPVEVGTWFNNSYAPGRLNASSASGNVGAYITYAAMNATTVMQLRIGISFVSVADAKNNLILQQTSNGNASSPAWWTLNQSRAVAVQAWEDVLGRVQVTPAANDDAACAIAEASHSRRPRHLSVQQRQQMETFLESSQGRLWALRHGLLSDHADVRALHAVPHAWEGLALANGDSSIIDALARRLPTAAVEDVLAFLERRARADVPSRACSAADQLTVFYTALYHSFAAPSIYSSADGSYLGFDAQVHAVWPQGRFLSDLSLWDIHRTQTPLLHWLLPDALQDMIQSLLVMRNQTGGILPRWPFANVVTGIMDGSHGVVVMADALLRGLQYYARPAPYSLTDVYTAALDAVSAQDVTTRYASLGYVPLEDAERGAALTMENAVDDAAVSVLAAMVGDAVNATLFANRSGNFRNIWAAQQLAMCPKYANGSLACPFDLSWPHPLNPWYVEGDTVQWTWFAPHALPELVALFPNASAYVDGLNTLLVNELYWPLGNVMPNAWYWAGNEPGILVPFQFAAAGDQYGYLAQYWSSWLLDAFYTNTPDGIPGNDDYGTMSAWAVWAYLGLYPIAGTQQYAIGSPAFANVTITVPAPTSSGAAPMLTVIAHNASATNVFVASLLVNGAQYSRAIIDHDVLFPAAASPGGMWQGSAVLEFTMTSIAPGPLPPLPAV